MLNYCIFFISFYLVNAAHGAVVEDWGLWPMVTPILGDISPRCKFASIEYIKLLNESFHSNTNDISEEASNALKRFDASGPLPFLQDGILMDVHYIDLCDLLHLLPIPDDQCPIAEEDRYLGIPYHTAAAPGLEHVCKNLHSSKYCHNYIFIYGNDYSTSNSIFETIFEEPKNFLEELPMMASHHPYNSKVTLNTSLSDIWSFENLKHEEIEATIQNVDPSSLYKISNVVLEKSKYARNLHSVMKRIMVQAEVFEDDLSPEVDKFVAKVLVFLWWITNSQNIPLPFIKAPYHGMCYPKECTMKDIHTNNLLFAKQFWPGNVSLASSPLLPYPGAEYFVTGCTDDENHRFDSWNNINTIAVTVLSIIAFFIISGTIMDIIERNKAKGIDNLKENPKGILFKVHTSFSIISNMEVIFRARSQNGGERLDCLDGIRALSMTWVILGHNFLFGQMYLHGRNKEYTDNILMGPSPHTYGIAFQPVREDFSVDTFIFIGSLLLSYLLMKDLDKSNGWLHPKGAMRMVFFYVNRYLRISIPYGLILMIFAGIIPLLVREPMSALMSAFGEGQECEKYWYRHLLYYNTFLLKPPPPEDTHRVDYCLGQTWYLAFDMQWFIISPLVVYPLWSSKFGKLQAIVSKLWWTALFCGFFSLMIVYAEDIQGWRNYHYDHFLPKYPGQAPWGNRSHCYLLGLLMGYILHSTKNKTIRIPWVANILMWTLTLMTLWGLAYGTYYIDSITDYKV